MHKKRVLVTGANGFLGRHVVVLLKEHGYRVSTLGRNESAHRFPHHQVDLARTVPEKATRGVDAVVHLACDVSIGRSIENPASYLADNLAMTLNVLEACRTQKKKPLLIFLSTDRVYGKARGRVTEASSTFPIEPYTASKIMGECALATYANLFDIPYITLRSSVSFGPHQPRRSFVSDVIQKMIEKNEVVVGPLKTVKNFTYVGNVALAILKALRAPHTAHNRTYNIGGTQLSLSQMLTQLKTIVEKKMHKRIHIHIDHSIKLPQKNEVGPFVVSNTAARKTLRYKESVPLKEGLEYTVDYFLKSENRESF